MLKALALEKPWSLGFSKTKKIKIHATGKTADNLRFGLAVALVAANLMLLVAYVYGVNQYANVGYQITSLQTQLQNLNQSNQQINLQVSEAGSMVSIRNDFLSANYVPAGTPKFLVVDQQNQLTQR